MAVDELEIRGDRQFAKIGVVTSIGGSKVRIKIQPDNGPQVARVTSGSFVIIYCERRAPDSIGRQPEWRGCRRFE